MLLNKSIYRFIYFILQSNNCIYYSNFTNYSVLFGYRKIDSQFFNLDFYLITRLTSYWFFNAFNFIPRTIRLNVHYSPYLYFLLYCFWLHWETSEKKNWVFKSWLNPWSILIFCFCRNKSNFCTIMLKCTKKLFIYVYLSRKGDE